MTLGTEAAWAEFFQIFEAFLILSDENLNTKVGQRPLASVL